MKYPLKSYLNMLFAAAIILSAIFCVVIFTGLSKEDQHLAQTRAESWLGSIADTQIPLIAHDLASRKISMLAMRSEMLCASYADTSFGMAVYDKNKNPLYLSERFDGSYGDLSRLPVAPRRFEFYGDRVVGFYPIRVGIEDLGWVVFSMRIDDATQKNLQRALHLSLLFGLLAFGILFSGIRYLLMRKVLQPIVGLTERMSSIEAYVKGEAIALPLPTRRGGREIVALEAVLLKGAMQLRKALQAQEEARLFQTKNEVLIEVASQVSHDIRSPLSALGILLKGIPNLPDFQRSLLENSIHRIREIANDLLQKRRLQPAVAPPRTVATLLQDLSIEFKIQAEQRNVQFMICIDPETHTRESKINESDFMRIVSNLVNNAFEASAPEVGMVKVELRNMGEHYLEIKVSDNGCGIPPEKIKYLGLKGFTVGKPEGSGLGLWHAKQCIAEWNGTFAINSVENGGTQVYISLPA